MNNKYRDLLVEKGLKIGGVSPDNNLVEMIELPDHPFFIASQFHPEFKSRPWDPAPLFKEFMFWYIFVHSLYTAFNKNRCEQLWYTMRTRRLAMSIRKEECMMKTE